MGKRVYSDEDKAAALALLDFNRGNVYRTAKLLGIPDSTLDEWAKGRNMSAAVPKMRERKKGELAEKFEEIAHMALDATIDDPEGLRKAGPQARIVVAGVATEKKLLLTGNPTQITRHVEAQATAEQAVKRLLELARERDPSVTKKQVVERLCEHRPELRPLLLSSGASGAPDATRET